MNAEVDVQRAHLIIYASIFLHLLMQAIKVEEHFHVQQAYVTQSDLSYFNRKEKYLTGSRGMRPYVFTKNLIKKTILFNQDGTQSICS